jgi:hypothetical protein
MRITTHKVTVGTVMLTGEVVKRVRVNKPNKYTRNPKILVLLVNPRTGKERSASWNYYGDVFVKNPDDLRVEDGLA